MQVLHSPKRQALELVIARTRAAVLGEPVQTQDEQGTQSVSILTPQHEQEQARDASPATPSPIKVPRHVYRHEQAMPRVLAVTPSPVTLRAHVPFLTRGAVRLHDLLVKLAADVVKARQYEILPSSLTLFVPTVGIALHLNLSERHTYRLASELEACGLIQSGGHAQNVRGRALWDGTLWAISLKPGCTPRIRADEWRGVWRSGFEADYYGKKGARAEMSELQDQKTGEAGYQVLRAWAAVQGTISHPLSSPDKRAVMGLDAVAAQVRGLAHVHHSKRNHAITACAQALSSSLSEPHRSPQWCRVLWDALKGEWEGRSTLERTACAVLRLKVDLMESAPWRRPGAVLMARL